MPNERPQSNTIFNQRIQKNPKLSTKPCTKKSESIKEVYIKTGSLHSWRDLKIHIASTYTGLYWLNRSFAVLITYRFWQQNSNEY